MGLSVSIKRYLQKQVIGQIWPMGHSFPTPDRLLKLLMVAR